MRIIIFFAADKEEFKRCKFSLSNSFAEPLSMPELLEKVRSAGGGGEDLRREDLRRWEVLVIIF